LIRSCEKLPLLAWLLLGKGRPLYRCSFWRVSRSRPPVVVEVDQPGFELLALLAVKRLERGIAGGHVLNSG
jgi:hypothetical protein